MRKHCSICGKTAGLKPFKLGYICADCRMEVRELPCLVSEPSEGWNQTVDDADMTSFCRDPHPSF